MRDNEGLTRVGKNKYVKTDSRQKYTETKNTTQSGGNVAVKIPEYKIEEA